MIVYLWHGSPSLSLLSRRRGWLLSWSPDLYKRRQLGDSVTSNTDTEIVCPPSICPSTCSTKVSNLKNVPKYLLAAVGQYEYLPLKEKRSGRKNNPDPATALQRWSTVELGESDAW